MREGDRGGRAALRGLRQDLSPGAGTPPLPPSLRAFPFLAWAAHAAVAGYALLVAGVAWHTLIEDFGLRNEVAGTLAVAQAAALPLALYWPMASWWLSLVTATLVAVTAGLPPGEPVWPTPSMLVHLSVLALVALRVRVRVSAEMWLITLLSGVAVRLAAHGSIEPGAVADMTVLSAAVLIAAGALRGRADALSRMARAERVSGEEQARRALLEERARIARELHDVVAHHMSVIAIQAEAAPYRVEHPPEALARSFAVIRAGALEALTELHRILGLLRNDTGGADPAPQPTLDDLEGLVAGVREAGLEVTLVTDTGGPVPPGVQLSAYRIVQEALSNVLRHAPGAAARVEIRHAARCLELRVANGPAAVSVPERAGSGHGVLGMRERAAMLGGELGAGPGPDGGYTVTARLPLGEGAAR
ncbi:sensor histidine kinase [Nonomuraea cavernae]|uniref:sensor histidine kinase n=1 Tax=Nonomuraea cavernae TaxID=2045107 RepID=UPI0033E1EB44